MLNSFSTIQSLAKYNNSLTSLYYLLGQTANTSNINTTLPITSMTSSNDGTIILISIYGLQNTKQGLWRSVNSGSTFTNVYTGKDNFVGISISTNNQYMFVCCQNIGRIYYSINSGVNWTVNNFGSNISSIVCDSTGQYVYASDFSSGNIYQSTNYGSSFSIISSASAGMNTNIINLVYIQSTNTILYTSSANGKVYTYKISQGTLSSYNPSSSYTNCSALACSLDGTKIYITYYGVSSNQLYYSLNSGTNWSNTTIASSINNFANVVCSPDGMYVYATSNNILYYSSNFGQSFNSRTLTSFTSINGTMNRNQSILYLSGSSGFSISK